MSELTEALKRIKHWLQTNMPSEDCLKPGLTPAQIDAFLGNSPFKLPREVRELYEFCDGDVNEVKFFPFLGFYSLKQAVEECNHLSKFYEELALPPYQLPIFFNDDRYYVICKENENIEVASVWLFTRGGANLLCYSSITSLILMIAECYETGAYFIATEEYQREYYGEDFGEWVEGDIVFENPYLEEDYEKSSLIFKKYNPEIGERRDI
jgi:hypothetical protein